MRSKGCWTPGLSCLLVVGCGSVQPPVEPPAPIAVALEGRFELQQTLLPAPELGSAIFGASVALDGDLAVIGARGVAVAEGVIGAAFVWERDRDGRWSQRARLMPSDGPLQHGLGAASWLSEGTAVVSAVHGRTDDDTITGVVHVFDQLDGGFREVAPLFATNPQSGDWFGFELASDGTTLVVTAPQAQPVDFNPGFVEVFRRESGRWIPEDVLRVDDPARVGFAYAAGVDGDHALVSQMELNPQQYGDEPGRVYAFRREAGAWVLHQQLEASDAIAGDRFGSAIDIDGSTALIGAAGRDDARDCADYVSPTDQPDCDSGAAYVFELVGGSWQERHALRPGDSTARDEFGNTVLLEGDLAVISAPNGTENGRGVGVVYIYERAAGGTWSLAQRIAPTSDHPGQEFGRSLALSGQTLLIGAPYDVEAGLGAGSVSAYVLGRADVDPARDAGTDDLGGPGGDPDTSRPVFTNAGTRSEPVREPPRSGAVAMDAGVDGGAGPAHDEDGGCGCRLARRGAPSVWWALGLLLALPSSTRRGACGRRRRADADGFAGQRVAGPATGVNV
jgi:hypothetical protein